MMNLLYDPIIGVETPNGNRRVTLPELLALLSDGQVLAYTGQRPHQVDIWHVFTVQLAAGILSRRAGQPPHAPPKDPNFWEDGLVHLAEGNTSAWALVADDVTQPAFLQHPLSRAEELARDFKPDRPKAVTPDELDVLVTARNHDLKRARLPDDDPEAWMYALVTYQTASGYLGAGNYGIIRMNSGFSSRPIVSLVASWQPSKRFQEETRALCDYRQDVLKKAFGYRQDGFILTWIKPWDRTGHQWRLQDLDPFFIEAARAVRLVKRGKGLVALGATTKVKQIGPKTLENGDVGDPWIPIQTGNKKKGRAALTVKAEGWTPQLLCDLLFEQGYELTPLQRPKPTPGTQWFIASVLVGGECTTEGFHRVSLPVPPKASLNLLDKDERDRFAVFAQQLQNDARDIKAALRIALTAMTEGGPESIDSDRKAVKSWVDARMTHFQSSWHDRFFPTLWRSVETGEEAARREWRDHLTSLSHAVLEESARTLPIPQSRKYRARTRAEGLFWGTIHKHALISREGL